MPKNQEQGKSKPKFDIKKYKKLFLIVVITLSVVFLAELFFNRDIIKLSKGERGNKTFSFEDMSYEGFSLIDGKLVMDGDIGFINIVTPDTYINRLEYKYDFDKNCAATIVASKDEKLEIEDSFFNNYDANDKLLDESKVLIKDEVSSILLAFGAENKGIAITEIGYQNIFRFSGRRMVGIGLFVSALLIVILYREVFKENIEYGFLVVAISISLSMLLTLPLKKISWDEEYHFHVSYEVGVGNSVVVTPEVRYYFDAIPQLLYPKTSDEFNLMEEKLASSKIYDYNNPDNYVIKTGIKRLSDIGHIPSAIGISIGRLLHLPFSDLFLMGKLFNALAYILITFFAIRHIKVGKRMLTAIALMPTPLFLASTYSYDAMVNAFAFLGLSYIFSELADTDSKITWKSYIIFMVSVFIATMIKMVYAPLLLFLLALPNEKFEKKSQKYIMKYGVFVLCFLALAVMLLPVLLNPSDVGDTRGGNTSHSGQMAYILSNPFKFIKMLSTELFEHGLTHIYSESMLGSLAYYDMFNYGGYISFFMTFVMLTDSSEKKIPGKTKAFLAVLLLVITCFIWSAMYISFTPVGAGYVNGVQGRYFIPISISAFLLINSNYIQCKISKKTYNMLVLLVPLLMSSYVLVMDVIKYCA